MSIFKLREYKDSDCPQIARLFYDTVHTVNAGDYTADQLDAWADGNVNLSAWNESFLKHNTIVAVVQRKGDGYADQVFSDHIVGFGDMDDHGYLDRLYVHKNYQRQGIARAICDRLEKECLNSRLMGTISFTTHASITARPFFEKRGYRVVREQFVERGDCKLTNYVMETPPHIRSAES